MWSNELMRSAACTVRYNRMGMAEVRDLSSGTWVAKPAGRKEALHIRKCRLEVISGPNAGVTRVFESSEIVIGRTGADLVLTDKKVSGMHAQIRLEDAGYRLRDLGSTNGTWIQNTCVLDALIAPGTLLSLGDTVLRFTPLDDSVEVPLWKESRLVGLIGRSVVMRELFDRIDRIAATETTVLISGDTGTGKELVAEAIHERSPRSKGAFVVLDCGAVPAQLFEDQLFGHELGAFTGASRAATGVFEAASGGTLFIDEIGELPLEMQPKLLRALESRSIRRIGADDSIACDVRLIAATNRNLAEEINRGAFRADLFYRVGVVRLHVPPLRDRMEDLDLLIEHFLGELGGRHTLPKPFYDWARKHSWPGNVRELRNAVERAIAVPADAAGPSEGPAPGDPVAAMPIDISLPFKEAKRRVIDAFDRRYITRLLEQHNWNISAAARAAGIDRMAIYKLLQRLGIQNRGP